MAEFKEIMRQAKRMCRAHDECGNCPLREMADMADIYCPIQTMLKPDAAKAEAAVMNWAASHPEPKYPSWNRWFRETFPNSVFATSPCPNTFCRICDPSRYHSEAECHKCKSDPIPADIAERLGIKPIGGSDNG